MEQSPKKFNDSLRVTRNYFECRAIKYFLNAS
jgi:hypothetical protein